MSRRLSEARDQALPVGPGAEESALFCLSFSSLWRESSDPRKKKSMASVGPHGQSSSPAASEGSRLERRGLGITAPIDERGPTAAEVASSEAMVRTLRSLGVFESEGKCSCDAWT